MRITATDMQNWRPQSKNPKRLRFCGTNGKFLEPHQLRRCPFRCELYSWHDYCKVCDTPTLPIDWGRQ